MLTFLKDIAGTWIAKILLGLLMLSFAVWGLTGAAFNFASGTLGKVGNVSISSLDFQREYIQEISRVSQQIGQQITSAQARQFGVDTQVLSRLVNRATLDNRVQKFGLGISDDRITQEILNEPSLQTEDGEFNAFRYQQIVAGSGLSEKDFIKEQKRIYERQQLLRTLTADVAVPEVLSDVFKTHRNEARTVEYFEIDVRDIDPVGTPDDPTLEAYFEDNKTRYRAPEYRSLKYIAISASDFGGTDSISDADAKAYFEANKARFSENERRRIRRISFDTEAKARDAEAKLKDGTSFDELVRELGLSNEDVSLGLLQKDGLFDKKLADAAFSLEAETPSGVIDGDFGKFIAIVDEIQGGSVQSFEARVDEIKQEIAADLHSKALLDRFDAIEDARAAGNTFEEIAAKLPVTVKNIVDVAQTGKMSSGADLSASTPARDDLLQEVFQSDVGIENDVLEIGRDGFVWYELTDIKAARERTLDEVKSSVSADWIEAEIEKALSAKADELKEAVLQGKTMKSLAEELFRDLEKGKGLKRGQAFDGLSEAAVEQVFRGEEGFVTVADGDRNLQKYLLRVEAISEGIDTVESEELQNLTDLVQNDVVETYVLRVREREGTSINEEAFRYASDLESQHGYGGQRHGYGY